MSQQSEIDMLRSQNTTIFEKIDKLGTSLGDKFADLKSCMKENKTNIIAMKDNIKDHMHQEDRDRAELITTLKEQNELIKTKVSKDQHKFWRDTFIWLIAWLWTALWGFFYHFSWEIEKVTNWKVSYYLMDKRIEEISGKKKD